MHLLYRIPAPVACCTPRHISCVVPDRLSALKRHSALQVDGRILQHPQLSYERDFNPGFGGSWNLKDVRVLTLVVHILPQVQISTSADLMPSAS